ncbi:DUF429 domain-containing protein [Agrococcus sp. Marseille-Q4369]|uniref:DUF429 domain-containing protein n=1 Tax=Agrococcus sp. Marseille-Q4369 TaxID=2810513 RepID=UPI001B8C478A|nr:DUF429 domain-containing protein [Agrococcus sp. Marseille-Q4369]QUW17863.1 DUF429 domain-containing protein [Agrococcus sp. Marseille-Q4369]
MEALTVTSTVHIGVDLAWGPKNRTGLAAVGADGRLLASSSAGSDDEIVDWIDAHAPRRGVIAIDAPLIVTNRTGRRACESAIHAAFGRFDASPHSTNLGKPEMNPPRGAVIAERLGFPVGPALRDRVAIEVYPHPAMVGLWELDLILKYKHKAKYEFAFRKREFDRLLELLEAEQTLQVSALLRWSELRSIAEAATGHSALDRIEDEVDGIVCAWLAYLWATSDERLGVYGDIASGYIVAPPAPTHASRPRALRQAPRSTVRFAEPAPDSTSDAVLGEPMFTLDAPAGQYRLSNNEARLLEATLLEARRR